MGWQFGQKLHDDHRYVMETSDYMTVTDLVNYEECLIFCEQEESSAQYVEIEIFSAWGDGAVVKCHCVQRYDFYFYGYCPYSIRQHYYGLEDEKFEYDSRFGITRVSNPSENVNFKVRNKTSNYSFFRQWPETQKYLQLLIIVTSHNQC